jgi:hypothetical protein
MQNAKWDTKDEEKWRWEPPPWGSGSRINSNYLKISQIISKLPPSIGGRGGRKRAGKSQGNDRQGDKPNGTDEEWTGRGFRPAHRACAGGVFPEAALDHAYMVFFHSLNLIELT